MLKHLFRRIFYILISFLLAILDRVRFRSGNCKNDDSETDENN